MLVFLVEEEVIKVVVEPDSPDREGPGLHGITRVPTVIVYPTRETHGRLVLIVDFPHLGDVLQCGDEALARGRVVHGTDPGALTRVALHGDQLDG